MAQLAFYEEIKRYEKLETVEERRAAAREIYDNYIMRELLSHTHVSYDNNINDNHHHICAFNYYDDG